jgi:hypothetical protein
VLDIIHRPVSIKKHRPVYITKHNVSEAGFCLHLQVKPTQLGPIHRASPYLQTPVPVRVRVRVTLRLTVSQSVAHDQLLVTV